MGTDIPFDQCDADSASVDGTGDTLDDLFTNLGKKKQRQIILYNGGSANILIGPSSTEAIFPIPAGSSLTISPKDLSKIWAKAASGSHTLYVFQVK